MVLHRAPAGGAAAAAGLGCLGERGITTNFTGLFPTASMTAASPGSAFAGVQVKAWSSLVPHDIENSSLPLVHVEITLTNTGGTAKDMAAAFSWQDVISRNVFDADTEQLDLYYPKDKGQQTCALDVNQLMSSMYSGGSNCTLSGRTRCRDMPRAQTLADEFSVASLTGVEQHTPGRSLHPNKLTMQQYNSRVAIMVQKESKDDTVTLIKGTVTYPGITSPGLTFR